MLRWQRFTRPQGVTSREKVLIVIVVRTSVVALVCSLEISDSNLGLDTENFY
jgi:hypothetical protein